MEPFIKKVTVLPGRKLSINYNDGAIVIKDLAPVIAKGNLASALDDDSFLKKVKIADQGYSLLWPNGLEFCADALRHQGEKQ